MFVKSVPSEGFGLYISSFHKLLRCFFHSIIIITLDGCYHICVIWYFYQTQTLVLQHTFIKQSLLFRRQKGFFLFLTRIYHEQSNKCIRCVWGKKLHFITNICVFTITVAKIQTDMLNLCKNFLQRRATSSTAISATPCLKTYILL